MERLLNRMRAEAGRQAALSASGRMAIVTSYDPDHYACKVKILPEGDYPDQYDSGDTGWLPVQTQWLGNGWGMYCPPSVGDKVYVDHVEDDPGGGQIVGVVFDAEHTPLSVQSGEFWLVHVTGSFFKLTNDGKLTLQDQAGSTIVMNGDGTGNVTFAEWLTITAEINLVGSLSASGHIAAGTGASGTFNTSDGLTVTVQDGIITNIN
jgi:phage baseplate assembly protein gpV